MLFYLLSADELGDLFARLGYDFDEDTIPRAIDYYLDRTSHGSILSRVVHAWVLARSDRSRSWQFVLEALESDVSDTQGGTTSEGIHLGAMAGTLDLLQRCYTGLEVREDACGSKRSCRRGSGASRSASSTADSWSSSSSRARVSRSPRRPRRRHRSRSESERWQRSSRQGAGSSFVLARRRPHEPRHHQHEH
jgi:Glycosyl hydrolase family 65 central catalytic domain